MHERPYVLGTGDEEIIRLGVQHRAWRPFVAEAWRRAGIGAGDAVVDLGCGPGYATLDLARAVGPAGRVIGVDRSPRFLEHVRTRATAERLENVETIEADLNAAPLPDKLRGVARFVWCRWVLTFLRGPRAILTGLADAMPDGGTLVIHEYYDYAAWRLLPRCAELEEFVADVMASWRDEGGEPDIGRELPVWLTELGFEIQSTRPLVHIATPSDPIWEWPATFVHAGAERLVALGRLSETRGHEIRRAFEAATRGPGVRMITPAVIEVIARKRVSQPEETDV